MSEKSSADISDVQGREFDYVIVGGGTSGLCLASRLAEDPNITVLVLEAGSDHLKDDNILVPAQFGSHFSNPKYDWAIKTTPQGQEGRVYTWTRGKALGGSSAINFLCWNKPPREEIDHWEQLGNDGWNWERYQKSLRKLEGYHLPTERSIALHKLNFDDLDIGKDGPIKLLHPATITQPELKAYETWLKLGIPEAAAPMSGDPKGALFMPITVDPTTYTRSYATNVFFLPHGDRNNLTVLTSAYVNKILTRQRESPEEQLTATGVEFTHGDIVHTVQARKEVILCAGALKSPQILELSGIGRKEVLNAAGIPVQLELDGVGENLQEHQFVTTTYELAESYEGITIDSRRGEANHEEHLRKLRESREGAFTLGITGFAFTRLEAISSPDRAKEILALAKQYENNSKYSEGLQAQYNIQAARLKDAAPCEIILYPGFFGFPNPPQPGKKYFTIMAALNHNFSRGTIHVKSSNPADSADVDPRYYEEDIDLQIFVETLKFARKVAESAPLNEILASPLKEVNPGPDVKTDEDLREYIKKYGGTTFHTIGTLSMLPQDKGGVVDKDLKVYGTANIRVVDLSIAPLHIAAHTMATAYAIAEQAADIIKGKSKL
ncbi:GMC oxidoreductase [Hydnomerulius pinastri MD-312]|uniref:GMC oxidoreductase n=1 Tax=Hydnomerulius pinastri MD-312 TaxID=994086 RepID=A0A0C9V763_9AGAM|nr:GMC oxidoreductase [Hydnomerulius pinastri MD-312]